MVYFLPLIFSELISRIMKKALRKDSATSDDETFARQHGRDDDTDTEHHDSLPHDEDGNERRPGLSKLQEIRRTRKPSLVDIVQIANSERERVRSLRKQAAVGNGGKGKAKGEKSERKSPREDENDENEKNKEKDNGNDPEIKTRIINERRQSLLRKKKEDEAKEKEASKEHTNEKDGDGHKEKRKKKEDDSKEKETNNVNEKEKENHDEINKDKRKKKEDEANGKEMDKTSGNINEKRNDKDDDKGNGKDRHKSNGKDKDKHKGSGKDNGKDKHKANGNGKEKENENNKESSKENEKEKDNSNGSRNEKEKHKGNKSGNQKYHDDHRNELDKDKDNEKAKSKEKDHDKRKEKEKEHDKKNKEIEHDHGKNDIIIALDLDKDRDKEKEKHKEGAIKHRIYESFRRKKREDKDKSAPSKQNSLEKTNEEEPVGDSIQPSPNEDKKNSNNKRKSPKIATTPDDKSVKSTYTIVDEKSPKLHDEKQISPPVLEQLQNFGGKLKLKLHKNKPSTEPEVFKFDPDKVNKEADIATTPSWEHLESELQSPRPVEDVTTPTTHKLHLGGDKFANISRQSRKKIGSFLNLMKDAVTRPEHEHHSDTAIDIPATPRLEISSAFNNAFMLPVAMHTRSAAPSPVPSSSPIPIATPTLTTSTATSPTTNNSIQPYISPRAPLEVAEDIDPPSYNHLMMSGSETHIVASKDPEELDKPGPIVFQQRSISQRRRPIGQDSQSSNWSVDNIPTITISTTPETEELPKSPLVTSAGIPAAPRTGPKVNVIKINIEQDK